MKRLASQFSLLAGVMRVLADKQLVVGKEVSFGEMFEEGEYTSVEDLPSHLQDRLAELSHLELTDNTTTIFLFKD